MNSDKMSQSDESIDSRRGLLEEETVVENPAVRDGTERNDPRLLPGYKDWVMDPSTCPPHFIYRGVRDPFGYELRRHQRLENEARERERLENERRINERNRTRCCRLNKWRTVGLIISFLSVPPFIGFCYYAADTKDIFWILAAVGVGLNSAGCCFCCFAGRQCLSSLWRMCKRRAATTSTNDQLQGVEVTEPLPSSSRQNDVESRCLTGNEEAYKEGNLRGRGSPPRTPEPSNETTSTGSCTLSIPSEDGVAILNTSAQFCAFKRPSYAASRAPIVPEPVEMSTSGSSQTSSSADDVIKGPVQSRQEYVPKPEETSTSGASQTSSSADDVVKDPVQSSQEYVTASEGLSSGELRRRKFLSLGELSQLLSSSSSDEEPKN